MDIYDFLYPLSEEQILQLAKTNGPINNVVIGIDKHCFGVTSGQEKPVFQFLYINGKNELKGYLLQLIFKQEEFYSLVVEYSYLLTIEFELDDPVNLYNSLIGYYRMSLEMRFIQTISNFDWELLKETYGDNDPTIIAAGPIEVLYFLDKREFYQKLVGEEFHLITQNVNYVYLLINTRNGLFKIGRSKNPLKREKTLQAEEPEIQLIKYWLADKTFENKMHKFFFKKRVRGEWFKLNINDVLMIRNITNDFIFPEENA